MPTHAVINVRDLLAFAHLQLAVRAGESGIDTPVTWAHASELEDPTAFLEGGELILTGGIGIPDDPDGQVRYLERLHDRGVAGLAIAQGARAPVLTAALEQAADRLAFPVLALPFDVPFVDIVRL